MYYNTIQANLVNASHKRPACHRFPPVLAFKGAKYINVLLVCDKPNNLKSIIPYAGITCNAFFSKNWRSNLKCLQVLRFAHNRPFPYNGQ